MIITFIYMMYIKYISKIGWIRVIYRLLFIVLYITCYLVYFSVIQKNALGIPFILPISNEMRPITAKPNEAPKLIIKK